MEGAKASLNLSGITVDNSKLQNAANQIDGELEDSFIYILGDTSPFSGVPTWFKELATKGYEAMYWFKENNDDKALLDWRKSVLNAKINRFSNPPATTR